MEGGNRQDQGSQSRTGIYGVPRSASWDLLSDKPCSGLKCTKEITNVFYHNHEALNHWVFEYLGTGGRSLRWAALREVYGPTVGPPFAILSVLIRCLHWSTISRIQTAKKCDFCIPCVYDDGEDFLTENSQSRTPEIRYNYCNRKLLESL